jgi:putative heme iron utilization protein
MSAPGTYHRPTTRGELLQALRDGKVCEVPGAHLEMTNAILRGWGNFYDFTISDSPATPGWALYTPTTPQ